MKVKSKELSSLVRVPTKATPGSDAMMFIQPEIPS